MNDPTRTPQRAAPDEVPPAHDTVTSAIPATVEAPEETEARGPLHYVWQTVSWILLIAAFAILFAAIVVPKIGGGRPYTVLTGSMRPDYPPGTLIVVKPRPINRIQVGDVITYQLRSGEPGVVTHRVVEVTEAENGERRFLTKGDANDVVDEPPVRPVQIRGVLWYSIPYLGYVNTWFTGNRRTVTVFVLAGLLFAYAAWQFYQGYREDRQPDPDTPDDDGTPPDESATEVIDTTAIRHAASGAEESGTESTSSVIAPSAIPTAPMKTVPPPREE